MLASGQRVGVAVSGGADSVFLLHALRELAPRWDLRLSVLHLDHCLRGEESRGDAAFVRDLAGELALPFHPGECDVARLCRETGDNLEQVARAARRRFFLGFLEDGRLDRVALGHTRSDQAETVLFRFLRGAGTAGLAGIRPVTPEGLVRPLLDVERSEVEGWLRERGIPWREDSSNADLAFARNRIRRQLLPQLIREWNPALTQTLAQAAEWALAEEAWWEQEISRLAAAHLLVRAPAVLVRTGVLAALPAAVARRLVRRAVALAKGDLRGVAFPHVEAILALAREPAGHGRLQVPGLDIFRSFGWLRLAPPSPGGGAQRFFRLPLAVPGRVTLPDGTTNICIEPLPGPESLRLHSGYNGLMGYLDADRISGSLEVRNWLPGDQYRRVGHSTAEKIKEMFQQAKIPLWERRHWPVVTCGDRIVCTRLFGPGAEFAADAGSQAVLIIRETAGEG